MLGKNRIKTIRSLEFKKFRLQEGLFVAEGSKLITALLDSSFEVEFLAATPEWFSATGAAAAKARFTTEATPGDLARATFLKTPPPCLALCRIPRYEPSLITPELGKVLYLDGIQDPGNLGSIVRLAGWFGIKDIVCSEDSADLYSPKAVQATMGALAMVRVHYLPPQEFLPQVRRKNLEITGTFLDGENIYETRLPDNGVIIFGNEGQGIRSETAPFITRRVTIPHFAARGQNPESLNVALSAAIVLSELKRVTQNGRRG